MSCSTTLTNITIVITVQKTVGATYNGMFDSFWGGTVSESYVDNGSQIIYTWAIVSGQTISSSGSPYTNEAQFNVNGTSQPPSGDTYVVTATTIGGQTSTTSGNF